MSSPIHSDMVNPRDTAEMTSVVNTGLGPATDRVINGIIDKINTPIIKNTVNDKILDPLKVKVVSVIKPYLYVGGLLYIIIIALLLIIIVMLIRKNK